MFDRHSFEFLRELGLNNNKEWFFENKKRYENYILKPCKEITEKLTFSILAIDENLEVKPVINKALTTIHRDLRYSKNKTPFKTRFGINFKRKTREWKKYPSFFFRIDENGYYFGLMVMKNDPDKFELIRTAIDENPQSFKEAIAKITTNKNLKLWGQDYKKYFYAGSDKELGQYYSKKNIYISCVRDKFYFKSEKELLLEVTKIYKDLSYFYALLKDVLLSAKKG